MAYTGLTTFLWFDDEAEAAAEFYVSLFPGARITGTTRYAEGLPKPAGSVMTVAFELFGQPFVALNGGPEFSHSEAVSFAIGCETQNDVDRLWDAIVGGGGQESQCGWCKDRFGLSWQVVPRRLDELLSDPDPVVVQKALDAMLQMRKIDVASLERAVAA